MDKKAMKKMFFSNKMAVVCSALILLIVLVADSCTVVTV